MAEVSLESLCKHCSWHDEILSVVNIRYRPLTDSKGEQFLHRCKLAWILSRRYLSGTQGFCHFGPVSVTWFCLHEVLQVERSTHVTEVWQWPFFKSAIPPFDPCNANQMKCSRVEGRGRIDWTNVERSSRIRTVHNSLRMCRCYANASHNPASIPWKPVGGYTRAYARATLLATVIVARRRSNTLLSRSNELRIRQA